MIYDGTVTESYTLYAEKAEVSVEVDEEGSVQVRFKPYHTAEFVMSTAEIERLQVLIAKAFVGEDQLG